jgi:hypothetical protein
MRTTISGLCGNILLMKVSEACIYLEWSTKDCEQNDVKHFVNFLCPKFRREYKSN